MRLTFNHLAALALIALALPLFASCVAMPTATAPALPAAPAVALFPTAAVRPLTADEHIVLPQAMPELSRANVTPTATTMPIPTPLPQPPTATLQPLGIGGLAFPPHTDKLEFGAAAHLFYTERSLPLLRAKDGGFGWIRQQIHWRDQEGPAGFYAWGELDGIVEDVNARGLKLLISIVRSPGFYTAGGGDGMPSDPKALGNFVAALAEHYKGRVHAIQIWNEQNLAHENGGYVEVEDAGRYVELVKEAYIRIKAVDPTIYVVSGAPASTAVNGPGIAISALRYYRAMFAYQNGEIRNYVDAFAIHPGGSANPPETLWPNEPSQAQGWTDDPTFYFRNIENIHAIMEEYGMGNHPVWITEFGWATPNNTPGFEFGNQVSLDLQAQYIERAMHLVAEQYPWIEAMFVWNLNFAPLRAQSGDPYHEQASFGILNADYSPRPSFWAMQKAIADLRAAGH